MSVLVVGTVAFDSIETPFEKVDRIVGGAATYITLTASYFTDEVNLVSVVGDDFPDEFIQKFKSRNINLDGLIIKKGEKTFYWSGKYHMDMNTRDTLETELNTLADFDPVLPESYKTPDFVVLGNLTPQIQMKVIEQLTEQPKLVIMDTMNFWIESENKALREVIKKVDVLMINDAEARELTNQYSLVKAAQDILKTGVEFLVIKKGEHGAMLFHENNVFYAPALPLEEVYDPTGAGDTFAGGFIGYLAKTKNISFTNMKRAVIYGSAMASFCVERFGTEKLLDLSQDDIEKRVKEFVALVQFDIELEE